MNYKLTLLKDLPGYPAGTEFCLRQSWKYGDRYDNYLYALPDLDRVTRHYVYDIIDDPTWFRKEVDKEHLHNLVCPECGSTKGVFFSHSFHNTDMDSYDYGTHWSVGFECECGHRRILYGTERGNYRMLERMKCGSG